MLGILTDKQLYPNLDKISYTGHSAGAQMVQRYALMSRLMAAKFDVDPRIDVEFIVANPSSYTYLDNRRFKYDCGHCDCNKKNCTCSKDCIKQTSTLGVPHRGKGWVCHDPTYNHWPYGLSTFTSPNKLHSIPYVMKSAGRASKLYCHRHVVYMVGQNDTCNDALPTCRTDCWKRTDYSPDEWPCYRNHMDTRCAAMLQGPFRRNRGLEYMQYLKQYYGKDTHVMHVIPRSGHDATAMFGSSIGLQELFDCNK